MKLNIKRKLFKLKYKPIVLDKNNIPNEKVIFCGNHLTQLDSKIVNSVTNRNITWLDNNYNYSKEKILSENCIGIFPEGIYNEYRLIQLRIMELEREIIKINNNPHLRSSERMIYLTYLQEDIKRELEKLEKSKIKIEKLGIKVINNDVLLPFNERAIKIAYETNTKIVPFAIDYNNLHKKNKIKIRFGEPITISSDTKEENELLRNTVKQLIYKNH